MIAPPSLPNVIAPEDDPPKIEVRDMFDNMYLQKKKVGPRQNHGRY